MGYERNITLTYIINSLMWGRFYVPVLALFYIASQVPLHQFAIIMAVFSLTILLFEIPSGFVADLLGKKNTLLIARLMFVIEVAIFAFADGFWPFLIAKIISGIAVSFTSGAKEAFLYDTLKKLKREKEHKDISGKMFALTNTSMAIVFIIGAYLFSLDPKLPAMLSVPFQLGGFILTFFLVEPYISKKKLTFGNAHRHLKEGLNYFWNHNYVKYLAFLSLPIFAVIHTIYPMASAYYEVVLIPISLMGLVAFGGSITTAFAAKKAVKLEEKLGDIKTIRLIQFILLAGTFLMAMILPYYGVIFYFLIALAHGLFNVLINHYANTHIETSHRATMLSIKSMGENIGIALSLFLFGYLTRVKELGFAINTLGLIVLAIFILLFIYRKKLKIKKLEKK